MSRLRTSEKATQDVERKPGRLSNQREPAPDDGAESAMPADAPARLIDPSRLDAALETALLTAERAMPAARLAQALVEAGVPAQSAGAGEVKQAVERLNQSYAETGRSFRIESVAGGYRLMTTPEFINVVAAVRGLRESQKLSRAAVETLAIIAYRQPVTRVDIESIRGSASGEVLRTLLEKRLVAIVGRAEELGRPMLYGTSRRFLEVFGMGSIRDLPPISDAQQAQRARSGGRADAETTTSAAHESDAEAPSAIAPEEA